MKQISKHMKILFSIILGAVLIGGTALALTAVVSTKDKDVVADTAVQSDFDYRVTDENTVTLTKYNGKDEAVTLPDAISGKKVTEIDSDCFGGCNTLTSITIPDSVTVIRDRAFKLCSSLTGITIPGSVTRIAEDVFENCTPENLTIYGDGGSAAEKYAVEHDIQFVDRADFKNVSVISKSAEVGTPINLYAIPVGGKGPYTYSLMYKKSANDAWTTIGKKDDTVSIGSFTPGKAVKYDIMIDIRDSTGTVKSKSFTADVKTPLKNKTTINAETVKVGEKIVLKGAASGGTGSYKYAFYYKKSKNAKWIETEPAYTTKSAAFKPGTITNYDVKCIVKDAAGKTSEKLFTVKVTQ